MSGKQIITHPSDAVYIYDGSMAGFYCCVYESVYGKEMPAAIIPEHEAWPSLLFEKHIGTDKEKAARVKNSIAAKISKEALELVENVFLSCLEEKELAILRFLMAGYAEGAGIINMLGHRDVAPLVKARRHLTGERQLLLGFVRFSDYNGKLVATITPKNFILPFIADHFACRYANEEFMIFDKSHKVALVYQNKNIHYMRLEGMELAEKTETEEKYRLLWKKFYNTIAIKERYNPKCRMSHMPKRYWENMTEMEGEV